MFQKLKRISRNVLILLNVLTAAGFLLGSYAYLFDPEKFWIVGIFALAAFYFLIVLLLFFLFWLFVKPWLVLISTAAILLAWSPLQNLFQLRFAPNFTLKKHPAHLRVMNWNIEHFEINEHKNHPEKKELMMSMISQYAPDVACFQEMVGSINKPSAINHIPTMMKQMGFSGFHYAYNPKLDYDGDHHFGLIIFSRYPIIQRRQVTYPPGDYNSIFQYVDILKGKDTIRVFNFHLQSLKFDKENLAYIHQPSVNDGKALDQSRNIISKFKLGFYRRATQSDRIASYISKSPHPVIVCGDFNDVPNSYAYHTIGKGLRNGFTEKGTGIGRTYFGISPTLRIDNIFSDPHFNIEQFVRIKRKISDHYPLIADLSY